jgi:hypothetical protein
MKGRWIVIVYIAFGAGFLRAQISPGTLSAPHSFLSGPSNCTKCHDLAKISPTFECLNCHKEISRRLDERRGLHPSIVGVDRTGRACADCHAEHNGRDFALIRWDAAISKFDHRRAGYALEGKHISLPCKTCHQPSHMSPDRSQGILVKDLSRTWLGLPVKCSGCHQDEHRGQLSTDCGTCHNSSRWKDAVQFNHERARYILSGSHLKVDCQKCHSKIDDPKPYVKFRDLPFADCTPCHSDPHKGAFRQSCNSCHQTVNWKPQQVISVFNHATTVFPLEGKHAPLACHACHTSANFKAPVAHAQCLDCHKKDPHRGQFSQREGGGDCAACHTVEGFKSTTFTLERHMKGRFPLLGKHSSLACSKCHVSRTQEPVYRFNNLACAACHSDVHGGQFNGPPHENKCEECHSEKGFVPSSFTLVRHRQIRFQLTGAHGAVVCGECHKSRADLFPPPPTPYHFDRLACSDCHRDPHNGELAQRMAARRADGSPAGCEACHVTGAWREIIGFNHDSTAFVLEGTHKSVACESCHKTATLKPGLKNVSFKSAPRTCSGCHDDVHGGQFAPFGGTAECSQCHKPLKWRPSIFDHETGSGFQLAGSHRNVPCAMCHRTTREISGRTVVMYKPTTRDCRGCHGYLTAGK